MLQLLMRSPNDIIAISTGMHTLIKSNFFFEGNNEKTIKLFLLLILVVSIAFGESSCTQNVTSGANSKYKNFMLFKHLWGFLFF